MTDTRVFNQMFVTPLWSMNDKCPFDSVLVQYTTGLGKGKRYLIGCGAAMPGSVATCAARASLILRKLVDWFGWIVLGYVAGTRENQDC